MTQERTTELLMQLLRCAVFGEILPQGFAPSEEEWLAIRQLAGRHDLLHLTDFAIRADSSDHDFASESVNQAIFHYLQQENAVETLRTVLEQQHIPFIFLKGIVLREFYPEPWMRSCGDIDVLVPPQEYRHAISALSPVGFAKVIEAPHDSLLTSKEGVHIEIHHTLILPQQASKAAALLKGVWDVSESVDGSDYEYRLPDEYFYLYHIAHMVKHFWDGGCGIRPFLDLRLLMQQSEFDCTACHALLAQCDLLRFAERAEGLAGAWFGSGSMEGLEHFADYIVSGGTFGTVENSALSWRGQSTSRAKYLLSRVFPAAEKENPLVQKHPWLLPMLWGKRWLRLLSPSKRQLVSKELHIGRAVSRAQLEQFSAMVKDLGLSDEERK